MIHASIPVICMPTKAYFACYLQKINSDKISIICTQNSVRPSFPMMTITSTMMMMMSCLVDPVGAEVANQSNSDL